VTELTATQTIPVDDFRNGFLALWKELFEAKDDDGPSWVLDRGTSMFETLAGISAEEASIPVSAQSANLAAQVNHTAYYIQELREGLATNWANQADWDGSWKVGAVDEAEWQALIQKLRAEYDWLKQAAYEVTDWSADIVGGTIAMVAHAAYHLGEIRQGIGVIKSRES
jgi:hypothetical protein